MLIILPCIAKVSSISAALCYHISTQCCNSHRNQSFDLHGKFLYINGFYIKCKTRLQIQWLVSILYELQNWAETDKLGSIRTKLICRYDAWRCKGKIDDKQKSTQERQLKRKIKIFINASIQIQKQRKKNSANTEIENPAVKGKKLSE